MDLVVVDRVAPEYVEQVASLLRDTGLHPRYDDLPRLIVHNNAPTIQTNTAIYVPADEAEAARQILGAYYEEGQLHQHERLRQLPPIYKGLITPSLIALAIGVAVGSIFGNPFNGFVAGLVSFIFAVQAVAYRRR